MRFKSFLQYDIMDCGPTCLRMVANYYGKHLTLARIREISGVSKNGVSLLGISKAAENLGFRTTGAIIGIDQLREELKLPAILYWTQNHFVVLYKVRRNKFYIADPASGERKLTRDELLKYWATVNEEQEKMGIVLALEPTPEFHALEEDGQFDNTSSIKYLYNYLRNYKTELGYILTAVGISSVLQFLFPFLTQSIIDNGIANDNTNLIMVIIFGQFALLTGRLLIDYVRSWFLLYVNSRVNITILSDYIFKLMRMPVAYFSSKRPGDILQRMNDHQRIKDFLTGPAVEIVFAIASIIVLSITLFIYSPFIFGIFASASVFYIVWTLWMLRYNERLNHRKFDLESQAQSQTLQIINGINDIKLNNAENRQRWGWEKVQSRLFNLEVNYLKYNQAQQSGSFFLNEGKNLLITYFSAVFVVSGQFTLGMMLAVQAIVGQLNGPITLLINLLRTWHDTKLSLERITEVRQLKEEDEGLEETQPVDYRGGSNITLTDLTFFYPGSDVPALQDINLTIEAGKTTAIVGKSGSGKTTLMKLLLRFHDDYTGQIRVNDTEISSIRASQWRKQCGAVMQESFIFADTVASNIAMDNDLIDYPRLAESIKTANIEEMIGNLPLGQNTLIGENGNGISKGQTQRILIARAVYKNPSFVFFDEATNSLDAINESAIVDNLNRFLSNRTAVVIAHRLSTIRNADKIIVMEQGQIVESGTHDELLVHGKHYRRLIENQMEIQSEMLGI